MIAMTRCTVVVAFVFMTYLTWPMRSQPESNLLLQVCSQVNVTDVTSFMVSLNRTFQDLRAQLSNNDTYFATAEQTRSVEPVFGLAQCREYMSTTGCIACFDSAATGIRSCAAANGARVVLDGCFLRYEARTFYDETTLPGNIALCGKQSSSTAPSTFQMVADELLKNLSIATPKIRSFFAASSATVGADTSTIYAVAQCVKTVTRAGCEDCLRVACSNLLSCTSLVVDGKAIDSGCFVRYSGTHFFADNKTTDITPFLRAGRSRNKVVDIIALVVGGVGILIILILAILIWHLRFAKRATRKANMFKATQLQTPKPYSYNDLKKATRNFSEDHKLGKGGFGDVYKGIVKDGNIVAVKRLSVASTRGIGDFESEVRVISKVHHRNLIRLLGYCSQGSELLLVLEYMANGSLEKFLYGEKQGTLNWKQRFDIIIGTARGIAYLHEQYHVTIIHRDIKPSNILLDNDFRPKIADFGIARLLPEDKTHVNTRFAGTLGYTAPEYAINGQLTKKVDVYSFGIVVLEIISGKRCTNVQEDSVIDHYLINQARNLYENQMHLNLVDETLNPSEYTNKEVKKIIEIALKCTQSPVSARPTMSEVVVLLS